MKCESKWGRVILQEYKVCALMYIEISITNIEPNCINFINITYVVFENNCIRSVLYGKVWLLLQARDYGNHPLNKTTPNNLKTMRRIVYRDEYEIVSDNLT